MKRKVKRRENERIGVFKRTEDSTRAMSLNEGLKKKNGRESTEVAAPAALNDNSRHGRKLLMYPNDAVNTKLSSHISATETGWRHNALDGRLFPKSFPARAPSVVACIRSQPPQRSAFGSGGTSSHHRLTS